MKKALRMFVLALDFAITWPFRMLFGIVWFIYLKIHYKMTFRETVYYLWAGVRHGLKTNSVFVKDGLDKAVVYYDEV